MRERHVDVGVLTVIRPELEAARAALGLPEDGRERRDASVYWCGSVHSELCARSYSVVVGCVGGAGNPSAAAAAAHLLAEYRPRALLLMGIAAGVRGKVRIGQVILSERVIAYEPAALVRSPDGVSIVQPRPESDRGAYSMEQDRVFYHPDVRRIADRFYAICGTFPVAPPDRVDEYNEQVVSTIVVTNSTIASGEKLLRDPSKLHAIRAEIHGKVEVGEMEAVGIVEACRQRNVPWLIVRGISDFGDDLKDDRFHELASKTAAAVMTDFIVHGLDAGGRRGPRPRRARVERRANRFVFGRPIEDDDGFVGRVRQKNAILRAVEIGQPVQLLGENLMGKSSMLRWAERHAASGRPVVSVNPMRGLSPASMVQAVAHALGKATLVARLDNSLSPVEAALALEALVPFVLLIDDADALAHRGEGFSEGFFNVVRDLVQRRRLTWISASRDNLYDLFETKGLTSRFLNDSKKEWIGALEPTAAREIAGDNGMGRRMVEAVGGFAYGLQWLGDQMEAREGSFERAYDAFIEEHRHVFHGWWRRLDARQRELLRACATREVDRAALPDEARQRLSNLVDRGLADEGRGRFRIDGHAWRSFVRDAS